MSGMLQPESSFYYGVNGTSIKYLRIEPPATQGNVIFLGGLFADPDEYGGFATGLAEEDFGVHVVGHRSHGTTDTHGFFTETAPDDFGVVFHRIYDENGGGHYNLVGHSYGAELLLRCLARGFVSSENVSAAVFYGASRSLAHYVEEDWLYRMMRNRHIRRFLERHTKIAKLLTYPFTDFDVEGGGFRLRGLREPKGSLVSFMDSLSRDPDTFQTVERYARRLRLRGESAPRTAFLHGNKDRKIRRADSVRLAKKMGGLYLDVPDLDHYLEGPKGDGVARVASAAAAFFADPEITIGDLEELLAPRKRTRDRKNPVKA